MNLPLPDRINVLHYTSCWLPQTMTWLYTHVQHLPERFRSNVACQWTQNLDQFPVEHLFSLNRPPQAAKFWRRIQRHLRLWDEDTLGLPLLDDAISRSGARILHSHFGNCGWANAQLARKRGLRHVVSFYGLDLSYLPFIDKRWVQRYREMSSLVDTVLCEGPFMARAMVNVGVDSSKIKIFRLGIDLKRFRFLARRNPANRGIRFLIAGSFREKKGIPYAIQALGKVGRKQRNIEVTVIGASGGSAREESEKRDILNAVERSGLRDRIRFLGYVPYEAMVHEFYRNDVFVSPSVISADGDTEGGAPVTIIEAAASGMPVMSTTHCDIPFVLSRENGEYLVPERDAGALAHSIERLLETRDWLPITESNRALVEQELDVEKQTLKLADIYDWVSDPAREESSRIAGDSTGSGEFACSRHHV